MNVTDAVIRYLLGTLHAQYETSISTPGVPISLELALYLWALLQESQPARILDLGSGFSSFVFRLWTKTAEGATTVWSVDHDPGWLNKTREFLESFELSVENTATWEAFRERGFDLILHDLGTIDLRIASLDAVLSLVRPGGLIVLDDVHFSNYAEAAAEVLERRGFYRHSLASSTRDRYGRYSWLVTDRALDLQGKRELPV
jgi:predicted O-methyltransferase YrrM